MAVETVRIEGLRGVLDALKQLPPEIVSKAGGPVKLSLKAAAKVIRVQAQDNVQRIIDEPNIGDAPSKSIGLLKSALIESRGKMPSGVKGERYTVRIRPNRNYPTDRGENVTAAQIGRQLEFGTEKRQPKPWLRPAFDEKKEAAVQEVSNQMNTRVTKVIKKLDAEASRSR